jgi:hypothetical protein
MVAFSCRTMKPFAASVLASICLICGCSRPATESRPLLWGVYQSARAIEAALSVGVTLTDFNALVRDMSKELFLARDHLKFNAPEDAAALKTLERYGELLGMYHDSAKVWQLQIESRSHDPELPAIAEKYGLQSAIRGWKDERQVDFDAIRQAIWSQASELQEEQVANVLAR